MNNLIRKFVTFPFYSNIIIVILLATGIYGFTHMKKAFFPETKSRILTVSVFYPGASPKEMEEGITTRIEESIRGLVGIKEITSTSSENVASVRVETTGEYDLDETLQEVKNAVDAIGTFPSAAERPRIFKRRSRQRTMFLGLTGDVDLYTLKKHAQQIEDDLLASNIVTQLSIGGYPNLEISVEVSEEDLLRYNLTFAAISAAIAQNNADVSGGQIKSDEEEMLIRSRYRSTSPDDIANIILRGQPDGSFLRIRDVASVKLQFEDIPASFTMNGLPAVNFNIEKLPEQDLEEISNFLHAYIDKFNEKNPSVELKVTFDFLELLNARLDMLLNNGGIGLILVVITLSLFLSVRLSFWVAWGIPASFLGMFFVAALAGVTVNMISLFGMILVIGILVDDGIVIGENIFTHFRRGKTAKDAAVDGTMEVLPAVITSIATTVVAFSPLFFVQGQFEFLYDMAFVVSISLIASLFEAFFVLPAHLSSPKILREKKTENPVRAYLTKVIDFMKLRLYGTVLKFLIRWRIIFSVAPIVLIFITMGLFQGNFIKATFFPSIPFDSFNVEIAFTPGSGEKRTAEFLKRFEEQVWEVEAELKKEHGRDFIKNTFLNVGSAFSGQENGTHAGQINVFFHDMESAPISSFEIASLVRKKIGVIKEAKQFKIGGGNRWGSPVSISLLGRNLDELSQAKVLLKEQLGNMPELQNITDNNAAGKQEILLKLKPMAYFLGMNQMAIAGQVRSGFFGSQAQRLQSGKDELRVYVRYPKEDRMNVGRLEQMKIKTPAGNYPLTELVDYTIERGPTSVKHFNGKREVRVDADTEDPYEPVPPLLQKIERDIIPAIKANFPGVEIKYQGQAKESAESGQQIAKYFGIAFIVMIFMLVLHFGSLSQALMVIAMIPLAWMGAMWGHGIEGKPVSMLSAWGMVALSGVIINDAVVFLSKFNSNLREGMKVEDAVYDAGLARFRAIVLTTITTTVGLYPLILERSFQAQFLIPMAIALAYGVLVGTGFILIYFPVAILLVNDTKRLVTWVWTGKHPKAEDVEKAVINMRREEESRKPATRSIAEISE